MGRITALGRWLYRLAEHIIAAMLAVMFVAFIIQIACRYLFNLPIGWTTELTLIMWLWLVLFGAAFVVKESEEIRFDLIYGAMGPRARLISSLITSVFLIVLYGISFPYVLDYVLFMKVEKTAYLDIRFDVLYFIYPVFAVAVIVRHIALIVQSLRGRAPEAFDPTKASSGV